MKPKPLPRDAPPVQCLPADAAKALQEAARTPIPDSDLLARAKAIEKAIEKVKTKYPQHFR